ncbi:hypothetical protein ADUPG1_013609 [Aduncisulcus paluster]|uniref:Reverse transcriptase/retrotransposon-derived protein RNase H-like domain-containing protein n=1 Tax=Aduncisulcus paluster TaxID=2918883 RepID=A0ABQ5K751_9EUKA|nr:hypothetical protein ADUPG1_013609 [Aduncisulcus paluster]
MSKLLTWETILESLEKRLTISHIQEGGELILRTDASTFGIGGVLLQKQEDREVLINLFSRKFTKTEQRPWKEAKKLSDAMEDYLRRNPNLKKKLEEKKVRLGRQVIKKYHIQSYKGYRGKKGWKRMYESDGNIEPAEFFQD